MLDARRWDEPVRWLYGPVRSTRMRQRKARPALCRRRQTGRRRQPGLSASRWPISCTMPDCARRHWSTAAKCAAADRHWRPATGLRRSTRATAGGGGRPGLYIYIYIYIYRPRRRLDRDSADLILERVRHHGCTRTLGRQKSAGLARQMSSKISDRSDLPQSSSYAQNVPATRPAIRRDCGSARRRVWRLRPTWLPLVPVRVPLQRGLSRSATTAA